MRRCFIPMLIAAISALNSVLVADGATAASRPNVVMIMTDNHGAWTLGCYGNKDIRTPNIDRLAQEGTLFDRAFASNPVCSPTRASVLTGMIPSQHGVHCFLRGGRLQTGPDARCTLTEFATLPKELKKAGYNCGLVGKWHLGGNMTPQEGFDDYWVTTPHGGTSTFYNAPVIENGKLRKEPQYLTDFWTQHAVKYIQERAVEKEQPFFLFLSYNGPYALSRLLLREGKNRHAVFYRDKELPSFPREAPHPWQLHNRDYQNNSVSIQRVATEVSGVDDGVGTVMAALQENGFDENTVVVFLADQGWVGGQGGFFGMGDHTRPTTAIDGMMKIPMIWRHPGKIEAGRRSQELVGNYDIMPSLLEHVGLPAPWNENAPAHETSPGTSFVSQFQPPTVDAITPSKNDDDAVFYEFEKLRCIRTSHWKLTHRAPNGPDELFDLKNDPAEFNNLYHDAQHLKQRQDLTERLHAFFSKYASPQYDLYNGGGSQTVIYDGTDEEVAQRDPVPPPATSAGFQAHEFTLPEGFSADLVAGPALVKHPTMGCFDDTGRLFLCDGDGVNMTAAQLEERLPNEIKMLEDQDGDGRFDKSTVFADKMTFPMGGAWHNGALFVASPPNIWRLEDTDDDGVADKRDIIVNSFGYNGNAASIHGCFFSPSGRLYWCDGYHGHEFKDKAGEITSQRKGSYIFSCWPDGRDVRIHCGGGMDNPVEVDFTEEGDMIGTVNILYTRPRRDCLVHWQYGGAYPHREAVLDEIKVTGDVLGPIHDFGHVAISGTTRYRSAVMDHRWGDNFFATQFNLGKVVRLELERSGSTYSATEREFLSCNSRDFHPTDVIEDADGSLLVVDTGGWFYRGCPTSQMSKPDILGGVYRIRRDGMTTIPDPRGNLIDWSARTDTQLMQDLKETRFAVREKAIEECVNRGSDLLPRLETAARSADILARRNAVWATCRIASIAKNTIDSRPSLNHYAAFTHGRSDRNPSVRQASWHAMTALAHEVTWRPSSRIDFEAALKNEPSPAVRREIYNFIGLNKKWQPLPPSTPEPVDREEHHAALYSLLDSNLPERVVKQLFVEPDQVSPELLITAYQFFKFRSDLVPPDLEPFLNSDRPTMRATAAGILATRAIAAKNGAFVEEFANLRNLAARHFRAIADDGRRANATDSIMRAFGSDEQFFSEVLASYAESLHDEMTLGSLLDCIVSANVVTPDPPLAALVADAINSDSPALRVSAINAGSLVRGAAVTAALNEAFNDSDRDFDERLLCLKSLADIDRKLSDPRFSYLVELIANGAPAQRNAATGIVVGCALSTKQLHVIAALLRGAGPQQAVDLLRLFKRSLKADLASVFLDNVENARSLNNLPMLEISEVVKRFPQELHDRANALLNKMQALELKKALKLDELVGSLETGDVERGQAVFFSDKSKCATCHVVGKKGKRVGPDLTTIGANRAAKDLLESIIFPSATLVRQYEPYTLLAANGKSYSGLVLRDTAEGVTIQQSTGEPVTVSRVDVDDMLPSTVSIMPKGLDEALTPQQIADLVVWLQTLR